MLGKINQIAAHSLSKGVFPAKRSMTNMSMCILDFDAEAADCNGIVKSVGSLIIGAT